MRYRFVLMAVLLPSGPVAAQTCFYVPGNSPGAGFCNTVPFGRTSQTDPLWSNIKYQTLLTRAQLGSRAGSICEIAFAPCGTGERRFKTIEIQMDYFQGTGTTLSTTFAKNISGAPVTVLKSTDYVWKSTANQWNRIGLQKGFAYVPTRGHLVIQIVVTGAGGKATTPLFRRATNVQRIYVPGWTTSPPATGFSDAGALKIQVCLDAADLHHFGEGCAGSNNLIPTLSLGGSAKLGNTVTVGLSNAPAGAPVVFILGATSSPPYPIPIVGTCRLYESLDITAPMAADTSGSASLRLPVATTFPLCVRLYAQWGVVDLRSPGLLTTSNYGRILTGN